VQTADECIQNGTAYITDAGRCGVVNSVGGMDIGLCTSEYLTGIPAWKHDADGAAELQGVVITTDDKGKAAHIERIKMIL
jgi:calcineurin-like phosphoesterase